MTSLPGIGPSLSKLIEKLAGPKAVDLLWHLPTGIIDRRYAPKIAQAEPGRIATLTVTVDQHVPPRIRRLPYRVRCHDDSGEIELVFFHGRPDYLGKILPVGETRVVSGKVEHFREAIQMTHPDHIGTMDELARLQSVEPVYRLTAGLTMKPLSKAIRAALERAPELPEWIDAAAVKRHGWDRWRESIAAAHSPAGESDLAPETLPRSRLEQPARARQRRHADGGGGRRRGLVEIAVAHLAERGHVAFNVNQEIVDLDHVAPVRPRRFQCARHVARSRPRRPPGFAARV